MKTFYDVPTTPVQVEIDEKTYQGSYRCDRRMIHVTYDDAFRSTQVGEMKAEVLARMILRELVRASRKNG